MEFKARSLSTLESRIVLALEEQGRRELNRSAVIQLLGTSPATADHVISSLRRKGWLERATWGRYLLIPPNQGPDALGESNLLALASRITDSYYIGFGTAAAHYGLTTQVRNVIYLVTTKRLRSRRIHDAQVRIVTVPPSRFFGFGPLDVFGYKVMLSDREKTVLDCLDRPTLAGGLGEAAQIFATGVRRFDWKKAADYLDRAGSIALIRRFGWLAEHLGAEIPRGVIERLRRAAERPSVSFLGPRKPAGDVVGYDARWRLTVNVPETVLRESASRGKRRAIRKEP
jgi:predicted transcriptional regulator of viral defense system